MAPKVLDRLGANLEATNQKMLIVLRTTLTQKRMGCLTQEESTFFKLSPFYWWVMCCFPNPIACTWGRQ